MDSCMVGEERRQRETLAGVDHKIVNQKRNKPSTMDRTMRRTILTVILHFDCPGHPVAAELIPYTLSIPLFFQRNPGIAD